LWIQIRYHLLPDVSLNKVDHAVTLSRMQ
jgi:hypothetical protein